MSGTAGAGRLPGGRRVSWYFGVAGGWRLCGASASSSGRVGRVEPAGCDVFEYLLGCWVPS